MQTTATNLGTQSCPYGSGAHPYLTLGTATIDGLILHVHGQTVLRPDERGLPIWREAAPRACRPFRRTITRQVLPPIVCGFGKSACPALSEVMPAIERSGLLTTDIEVPRLHYAETLRHWRRRFATNRDTIASRRRFYLISSKRPHRFAVLILFPAQYRHPILSRSLRNSMNSRLRWRSLTSAWTLPVSRSIPANRLSVGVCTHDPARSSHGGLALAANPVPSWRWPGFQASRRKRRSRPARQVFVPRQRTMASPDSRAASLPATPGLPVRSATATGPSVLQSPLRSSPTRPLAAILP